MSSPTDGLPWPVVLALALVTLAALYGIALLAARLRRPPPVAAPSATPARVVHARETAPYRLDAGVTIGGGEPERHKPVRGTEAPR